MSKMNITSSGYEYAEKWDLSGVSIGYMPLIIEAAKSLEALQKKWEEILAEDKDGGITQYHEESMPMAILLEVGGEPFGVVRMLDDSWQFCQFSSEKVQED